MSSEKKSKSNRKTEGSKRVLHMRELWRSASKRYYEKQKAEKVKKPKKVRSKK